MATIDTGRAGEDIAASHLEKNGYVIIGRNVKSPMGEIDIVARERDVVCFIEVRSRTGARKEEEALGSVDRRKQMKLSRLALSYLKAHKWLERRARFDVVAVLHKDEGEKVVVIKDAFPLTERHA